MNSASDKKKAPDSKAYTECLGQAEAPSVRFEIYCRQFLRPDGTVTGETAGILPDDTAILVSLYEAMVLTQILRRKGDCAPTDRATWNLCVLGWPGGGRRRRCGSHA